MSKDFSLQCPILLQHYPKVVLAHGGGGSLMHELIEEMFCRALDNDFLRERGDAAVINEIDSPIAFTTDSYVVSPLFFEGGDIGTLAVCGTVNDLAMAGACPRYLSLSFVLEEGFELAELWRIVCSIAETAKTAEVEVVTGDTKVVERGKADGVFVNTSGIGFLKQPLSPSHRRVQAGDRVLISGDIGRHGIAILAEREGLNFETSIQSDCKPLWPVVSALLDAKIDIHCMRDLTRGGLATALVEISDSAEAGIQISENSIQVCDQVRGACELLGFDPLYVANEGCFVAFVSEEQTVAAIEIMKGYDPHAEEIGSVIETKRPLVTLNSQIGSERVIDMQSGEQLPRIC